MRNWRARSHNDSSVLLPGLVFMLLILLVHAPLRADIAMVNQIKVSLRKNGEPFNTPAKLEIECFGWVGLPGKTRPEPYTAQSVYSHQADCSGFGCEFSTNTHLNYKHIDYCDLTVSSRNAKFVVAKYGQYPFGKCKMGQGSIDNICELNLELP